MLHIFKWIVLCSIECGSVVVLIVTYGYISTEGSLAFGQAYRGALPPLPPGGEKTTSGNKYLM